MEVGDWEVGGAVEPVRIGDVVQLVVFVEFLHPGVFNAEDDGVRQEFFPELDDALVGSVGALDALEKFKTVGFGELCILSSRQGICWF